MANESRKKAVALRYDPVADAAPRVIGSGQGVIAESILRIAREHNIPIHEDPDLVEILGSLKIGELIPEEIYGAVAEILAFLYRLNKRAKPKIAI